MPRPVLIENLKEDLNLLKNILITCEDKAQKHIKDIEEIIILLRKYIIKDTSVKKIAQEIEASSYSQKTKTLAADCFRDLLLLNNPDLEYVEDKENSQPEEFNNNNTSTQKIKRKLSDESFTYPLTPPPKLAKKTESHSTIWEQLYSPSIIDLNLLKHSLEVSVSSNDPNFNSSKEDVNEIRNIINSLKKGNFDHAAIEKIAKKIKDVNYYSKSVKDHANVCFNTLLKSNPSTVESKEISSPLNNENIAPIPPVIPVPEKVDTSFEF